MALIASLATLCGVTALAFVCAGSGQRLLRAARLVTESRAVQLVWATAVGFLVFEAALALAEFLVSVRISVTLLLAAIAVFGFSEWRATFQRISEIVDRVAHSSRSELFLACIAGCVLLLEGLAAMAPLTGSDALHYHFSAPLHILRGGFHPDYFLTTSFLTGQGHLLILSGLALGSEKLAMGLLFLPGALTAAGVALLARKWVSRPWAWVAALAFLLNPVVFWQATASGSPDLWMSFFAVAGVFAIVDISARPSPELALLCGLLAGGIAGAKYTGCLIAASLFVGFLLETRSLSLAASFLTGSAGAGVWPYLRNLIWTGDPIFPFGLHWLAPSKLNPYAFVALVDSTIARGQRTIWHAWRFPFFSAADTSHMGFWEFFGPLILTFGFLFLFWKKRTATWRVTALVWILGTLAIGASSGMPRYTLPLLPLALAAAIAGAADISAGERGIAWLLTCVSIAGFLLLGFGGMAVYTRPAIAASVGLVSRQAYLQQRSPDYAVSTFVNRSLAGREREGCALVFFRHTYYLDVPSLNGDPTDSWAVDPARLATTGAWREFLRRNHIGWIVRAPDYPEAIAAQLGQLEQSGSLVFFAHADVTTFEGMRILGIRRTFTATIFRVTD